MNELLTVFVAEIARRVRSRAFTIGLVIGAIGVIAFVKFPALIDSASLVGAKKIVVVGNPTLTAQARMLLRNDFTIVATSTQIPFPSGADLRRVGADGIVELEQGDDGLHVIAYVRDPGDISERELRRDLLPLRLQTAEHLSPERVSVAMRTPMAVKTVGGRFESAAQSDSARVVAFVMLFVLYLLVIISSQSIMSSVAEEKTSRIAELLVSTVRPSALLTGKVGASLVLALLQLTVWIAVGLFAGATSSPAPVGSSGGQAFAFSASDISTTVLVLFFAFFVIGMIETATMFAALGSLVNRTEDLGSLSGPLVMPLLFAFLLAMFALSVPESPLIVVTSFVPLLSPFVMVARIAVGTVPAWQIALAIALNLVAIWIIVVLGGKIYRVGMLLFGRAPSFRQVMTALRG